MKQIYAKHFIIKKNVLFYYMGQFISMILNMLRGQLNLPTPTPENSSSENVNNSINESTTNNIFSESIHNLINESRALITNNNLYTSVETSIPQISVPQIETSVPQITSVPENVDTFIGNTDNLFKTRTNKISNEIFKRNVNENILGPKSSSI